MTPLQTEDGEIHDFTPAAEPAIYDFFFSLSRVDLLTQAKVV